LETKVLTLKALVLR